MRNYTTSIDAEKTIMEIEKILARYGASHILKEYDGSGRPIGLNFIVVTEYGRMPFKLPMDVQKVRQVLINLRKEKKIHLTWKEAESLDHALNVGWRIIKDWVDSQLSLLTIDLVKLEQIFLPYIYDPLKKQTLYERLKEKQFVGLLTEAT